MPITGTQNDVQKALRAFLLAVLPSDFDVVIAIQNRVPEPLAINFVVLSPIRVQRLRTNVDTSGDVRFTGSIAPAVSPATGGVMTVDQVDFGTIKIGAVVFGVDVETGTTVLSQVSGPTGGAGVYTVSEAMTIASTVLAAGQKTMEQGAEFVVQCDFHTANNTAADAAQTVATSFRDEFAVRLFADQGLGVVPLYADDPRFMPFFNDQQQAEWRWVLDAHMQVNQVVTVPQQYADVINVILYSVDVVAPP